MRRFAVAYAALVTFLIGVSTLPIERLALILLGCTAPAALFAIVTSRPVQIRLGIAQPPAVKYRKLYDDLNALYQRSGAFVNGKGPPTPRAEWEPRIARWDARFWRFLDDVSYARAPSIRSDRLTLSTLIDHNHEPGRRHAGKLVGPDWQWASFALDLIGSRMEILDDLLEDLPKS